MRIDGPGSHYSGPPSPGAERERDWIKKEERDRAPRDEKWDRDTQRGGGPPLGPVPPSRRTATHLFHHPTRTTATCSTVMLGTASALLQVVNVQARLRKVLTRPALPRLPP